MDISFSDSKVHAFTNSSPVMQMKGSSSSSVVIKPVSKPSPYIVSLLSPVIALIEIPACKLLNKT